MLNWIFNSGSIELIAGNNEIKEDLEKLVPWTSIDLVDKDNDILALLDKCDWLDRTALGIDHMPGGQVHGYKRWEAFKKTGLSSYAAKRNNPMLRSALYIIVTSLLMSSSLSLLQASTAYSLKTENFL